MGSARLANTALNQRPDVSLYVSFPNDSGWTGKIEEEDTEVFGGRQPLICATVDRCPHSCVSGKASVARIVAQDADFESSEVLPIAYRDKIGEITKR